MTSSTLWQPESPAGHAPYCVWPSHPLGTYYCAADPSEPDTMRGRPSKAFLRDHPEPESAEAGQDRIEAAVADAEASPFLRRHGFWLDYSGLAQLAADYEVDEDRDALLAIEAALPGTGDHPLISGPCAMAVDLLADSDGEIDGYRIIIHPTPDLNEPWIASPICRVSDLEQLERRVGRPNYDTAEIIENAVKTANELLEWSKR